MSTSTCDRCKCSTTQLHKRSQYADQRDESWVCASCAEDLDELRKETIARAVRITQELGECQDASCFLTPCDRRSHRAGGAIVPIEQARPVALARSFGRPLSGMETHLVQHVRDSEARGEVEEPITVEDELQLAAAFEAMRDMPTVPKAKTDRERKKIGEAIARLMLGARDGDSVDRAVKLCVAALGPDEAMAAAKVLADWAQALIAYADRAAQRGMRR